MLLLSQLKVCKEDCFWKQGSNQILKVEYLSIQNMIIVGVKRRKIKLIVEVQEFFKHKV